MRQICYDKVISSQNQTCCKLTCYLGKCINCQGPHSATSKACPMYSKEQQMLELKSRNHLTTGEARRSCSHASNTNYATVVKSNTSNVDFESTVNQKIESVVQSLLDKMEHQTLAFQEQMQQQTLEFQEKMEQQTLALMAMFEKTVETLLQNFFKMVNQTETKTKSPSRKKSAVKNFANFSSIPMHLDAEGHHTNLVHFFFFLNCAITNKLSQTHFKICDTIQTIALRVALGLPIWTPNIVLLKIAGQEILSENIKRLAIQFFIEQVANGVHSPLFRQSSNPCIQFNKKDQEAFAGLLADLNITSDHIMTLPNILDVLHNDICEIHLTSFGFQDKAQPTFMIKALFEETISEEFQDYFIIATDASKSHIYPSIAGTSNLRSFSFRIHPINSIFTAEALAIWQAIDDLSS
ncbi:hypothetical protein AVEN_33857-1 [Araneus ventricosus]|uniref:Uncharacterized protein n=1 Tax=Araneus ventricosus TaxID=182803 RepID=A0A4Y2ULD6_ARAVE|nr:hypothetical protein AVEN_33857-1 [Araneus ventricosus]